MKELPSAPLEDFTSYIARPDTHWFTREQTDSFPALYEQGLLPYSSTHNLHDVFYSACSVRVMLEDFTLSSENRRIAKKFDGTFAKTYTPCSAFAPDPLFWELTLAYFETKHGAGSMPRARLETILSNPACTTVVTYLHDSKPVAYILEATHEHMGHYWFSFYDLSYATQSLGMWLMVDAVRSAKERGLRHYYLGTVYNANALYKTNFTPLEWWDGHEWNRDVALLKTKSRN